MYSLKTLILWTFKISSQIKRTDDTADHRGSRIQDKHRLIRRVYVHLQKKTDKMWVVHQAPEALTLVNFLPDY